MLRDGKELKMTLESVAWHVLKIVKISIWKEIKERETDLGLVSWYFVFQIAGILTVLMLILKNKHIFYLIMIKREHNPLQG